MLDVERNGIRGKFIAVRLPKLVKEMSEGGILVNDKCIRKMIQELYGSSSTGIQHFLDPKSDSDTPVRNRTYSNTISAKCVFINCKDISVSTVSMLQSSMYIITIMHLCFCFAVVKKENGNIHQQREYNDKG